MINPLPISSYSAPVRYRFAVSEAPYLHDLLKDIFAMLEDEAPLASLTKRMPLGVIDSPTIVQCLLVL